MARGQSHQDLLIICTWEVKEEKNTEWFPLWDLSSQKSELPYTEMCKAEQSRLGSGNSALGVGHPESEMRYPSGNTEKAEGEFWCKDVSQGVPSVIGLITTLTLTRTLTLIPPLTLMRTLILNLP